MIINTINALNKVSNIVSDKLNTQNQIKQSEITPEFLKDIQSSVYRISTRESKLALSQVYEVIDLLVNVKVLGLKKENFQIVPVKNVQGDENLKDPLYKIGGQGVFTKQVEDELLANRADIAVHSLKDLPTIVHQDLVVAAVPGLQKRADVIIFKNGKNGNITDLPENAIIGTSSLRRITNLKNRFPNFQFKDIRGNLQTRFQKLQDGDYDAMILAEAGLDRLGLNDKIGQILTQEDYLYAPGQGALGVQCRKSDKNLEKLLGFIQNQEARIRVDIERQFLNKLEGGCKLPIGVFSKISEDKKQLQIIGQVWSLDGKKTIREEITGDINDENLGLKLSDLMKQKGAHQILKEINDEINETKKQ